jgi:hypothetical protein
MRITNRLALNREISVTTRERAYRETWGRPRWADGSPIRTDRPGNPIPAGPRVPALPPVDEALARLERAAANATPNRTDAHGGPSVDQIIAARRRGVRTIATGSAWRGGEITITPTDPDLYRHPRPGTHEASAGEILQMPSAMQRLHDAIPGIQQRAFDRAMTGS